jgi:hypothetical protein
MKKERALYEVLASPATRPVAQPRALSSAKTLPRPSCLQAFGGKHTNTLSQQQEQQH